MFFGVKSWAAPIFTFKISLELADLHTSAPIASHFYSQGRDTSFLLAEALNNSALHPKPAPI